MPAWPKITPCVNCRQMKLKCDAQGRFPEACSRCLKHTLSCVIDPSFRRHAKRERVRALEKEIQVIKDTAKDPNNILPSSRKHPGAESSTAVHGYILAQPPSSDQLPETALPAFWDGFETQILDGLEIQPDTIRYLIERYYSSYHPLFPILPDITSFARAYNKCPLLFWTIMAIGSKYSTSSSNIYLSLSVSVPRLAGDLNAAASQSLETTQALLLLCWWPFPFQATINDPSWTYCGLATHRALQFGIHRGQNHSDFFYHGNTDVAVSVVHQKTWLGCYITNQMCVLPTRHTSPFNRSSRLSSHLGNPATIQPDSFVLGTVAMSPARIPRVLQHYLRIAHLSQQVCQTLGNYPMTPTGLHPSPLAMMSVFELQFRSLETQIRSDWSHLTQVMFWRAELQLYSFTFPPRVSDVVDKTALDTGSLTALSRGCIAASSLIHAAVSLPDEHSTWTNVVRIGVGYAVFFLLKISSSPELQIMEPSTARNSISKAWSLLHNGSEIEHDHFSRVCAIIEYLSKTSRDAQNGNLSLTVSSRMSANLLWDAAWRAKERFSESIKESQPDDYTSAAAVESLLHTGLDFQITPSFLDQFESGWDFLF